MTFTTLRYAVDDRVATITLDRPGKLNAINDALAGLGVEINQIPATPERILGALLNAGAGKENAS